jgi:ribosomal-protein-alanine N-acetyltransferase
MLELSTKRLRLIALDADSLHMSLADPELLERDLGLRRGHAAVVGEVREAVQQMLDGVLRDTERYLWYTHWVIVLNHPKRIAGGLCFKGPPGPDGQVEVGYGIDADCQNRGLMTEALDAACRWALGQPGVSAVVAETDKANLPSQRVLEKMGFIPFSEVETMRWWRLERQTAACEAARAAQDEQGGVHGR